MLQSLDRPLAPGLPAPATPGFLRLVLTAAAARYPAGGRHWISRRAKFVLRAAASPRATTRWLAFLNQRAMRPLWVARPRLASKLQRPYLRRDWTVSDRLEAMLRHYSALARLFGPQDRERLHTGGIDLLQMEYGSDAGVTRATPPDPSPRLAGDRPGGGAGWRLLLRLAYHDQFEKEGDLTLSLRDGSTGLLLAGITFCLGRDAHGPLVWIGGLQGSPDPRARAAVHDAAKDLHGMRPKAFVLWSLGRLAEAWGFQRLRAVSDGIHVCRHRGRRPDLGASYDRFWAESGGRPSLDGCWDLPIAAAQRPRSDLKPSRRKAHERRYALLESIAPRLSAVCGSPLPARVTV